MTSLSETPAGPLLPKAPTGVRGLDEITGGGLPMGRSTLVTGGAGCGKTLLGVQFLVAGAREYGEPGVLVTFEESAEKITANFASLGFDLDGLLKDELLVIYRLPGRANGGYRDGGVRLRAAVPAAGRGDQARRGQAGHARQHRIAVRHVQGAGDRTG